MVIIHGYGTVLYGDVTDDRHRRTILCVVHGCRLIMSIRDIVIHLLLILANAHLHSPGIILKVSRL